MQKPVSIYELLHDEALNILKARDFLSSEFSNLLQDIVCLCLEICPELEENSPKPIRKMILDEANKLHNIIINRGGERERGMQRGGGMRRAIGGRGFQAYNRREERNNASGACSEKYWRSEASQNENCNTRFIPRNSNSSSSRPGQRFNRRPESNWREK